MGRRTGKSPRHVDRHLAVGPQKRKPLMTVVVVVAVRAAGVYGMSAACQAQC